MEILKRKILKLIKDIKDNKQYNFIFKINIKDIKLLGIKEFIFLLIKSDIEYINIELNYIDLGKYINIYNKLTKLNFKINLFIIINNIIDINIIDNYKIHNRNYIIKINYDKYNYNKLKKYLNNINKNSTIFLSLKYLKNQKDVNKSYFLNIFNLFRRYNYKLNTNFIRYESAFKNIYLIGPKELNFDINEYCNSNCIFCYTNGPGNTKRDDNDNKKKINKKALIKLINDLEYLGTEILSIGITGEPLLNNELIKIFLKEIGKTKLKIGFLTNGYNLKYNIKSIIKCKNIKSFYINISAGDKESFLNTKIGDNFNNFLSTWKSIKYIKEKRPDIKIKVLYIVTPLNYKGINKFIKLCKITNVDNIEINKATTYNYNKDLNINNYKNKEKIYNIIKNIKKEIRITSNICQDNINKQTSYKIKDMCLNHYMYLSVYKDKLYSCCKFSFNILNIKNFNILNKINKLKNNNIIFKLNNKNILSNEKCNRCIQYKNTIKIQKYIKLKKNNEKYL